MKKVISNDEKSVNVIPLQKAGNIFLEAYFGFLGLHYFYEKDYVRGFLRLFLTIILVLFVYYFPQSIILWFLLIVDILFSVVQKRKPTLSKLDAFLLLYEESAKATGEDEKVVSKQIQVIKQNFVWVAVCIFMIIIVLPCVVGIVFLLISAKG